MLAALSVLNSSGATEKVAALVAQATCSGASVDFESFRVFLTLYLDCNINIILIIYEVLKV